MSAAGWPGAGIVCAAGIKATITILNHAALGNAPAGYVLFEISSGPEARPRNEWITIHVERNPHTGHEFKFSESVVVLDPPRLAKILDALDRALTEVADDLGGPACATVGCASTAVMEVFWPGKTVSMCQECAWRATKVAETMGVAVGTRSLSEKS